jgi:PAS domain S-box-containing protein
MIQLLLVDNDPDILELLRLGLENMGHGVRCAESGLAALRAIEEEVPDILITDLIMPNISGEKLLSIIHAVPEWSSIRTIVISGVAAEAPRLRDSIVCDIYIAKGPITTTLKYLHDSIEHFDRMKELSKRAVVGIEEIFSRHITRELLEFKTEVDTMMNHITDGICRVDESATIVWTNKAFTSLLGLPEEKVLGRELAEYTRDKHRTAIRDFVVAGETSCIETELESSGGGRLVRATRLNRIDRQDRFCTILWQDVTDRLLSEEHYENVVESSHDLICTTDREGRFNYISRSSTRIAGRTPEEMIGYHPWDFVPASYRETTVELYRSTMARFLLADQTDETAIDEAGQEVWETPFIRSDDEERLAAVSCTPFRNRAGSIMGMRLVLTDITKHRRLEEERDALIHELQHRVRDNLQLVTSIAQLSDPEKLHLRIATVSEVFDELYREQSFSRIKARPLLERIVSLGLANNAGCAHLNPTYRIEADFLPMKTAVPLALLVTEVVNNLQRCDRSATLEIVLTREGEKLSLQLLCRCEGVFATTETDITSILAAQLRGEFSAETRDSTLVCTLTFIPDPAVS